MKLLEQLRKEWRKGARRRVRNRLLPLWLFVGLFTLGILSHSISASADSLFKPDNSCTRSFIYRNRSYPVDSSRKLDAEGLRFLLKKNPDAETLLNSYQNQLNASLIPAYTGALGIAMAVGGPLYAATLHSPLGQRDTRNVFLYSGIFMVAASYLYGQWAVSHKEKTLEKAVETYNDAVPEPERIRVELTPLPSGNGGEIKTQIPFSF